MAEAYLYYKHTTEPSAQGSKIYRLDFVLSATVLHCHCHLYQDFNDFSL